MEIQSIRNKALDEIKTADDTESLEQLRIKYLGRKGEVTRILRGLKDLTLEKRREMGPKANQLRKELEDFFAVKLNELKTKNLKLKTKLDVTRPGRKIKLGHLHPLSKLEEEIRQIFLSLNFSVVEGPEIEDEFHTFEALNIPANHPARDAWDTFWLKIGNSAPARKNQKLLLRPHTSPMQIRYMEKHEPPFQIIVPGRVFRYEATDATHEINFNQIEGLMVGKDISLSNFKFIVEVFLKKLFGPQIEFKFMPSYYPFVEPGLDVYMKWRGRWLEVAGAGMVHRKVFEAVRYDPNEWQGFAFGFGPERLAMIKYNIPDIRLFYSGDLRFIEQF